jgi:hypothetical protein
MLINNTLTVFTSSFYVGHVHWLVCNIFFGITDWTCYRGLFLRELAPLAAVRLKEKYTICLNIGL